LQAPSLAGMWGCHRRCRLPPPPYCANSQAARRGEHNDGGKEQPRCRGGQKGEIAIGSFDREMKNGYEINGKPARLTWDSVGAVSSSLSGAAPREAPSLSPPMPLRLAKFSSLFAFRISTCCSSRRRLSSSGLKVFLALNCVRRCSGMYRSAILSLGVLCFCSSRGLYRQRWVVVREAKEGRADNKEREKKTKRQNMCGS